ncbi:MAG: DoxX family protein [Myxococcota bacterium]
MALAFLAAGTAKLLGVEDMVTIFAQIAFGQWFRYVTGGLEVISAVLVSIPATAWFGAALLACVMAGAALIHLVLIGGSAVPAPRPAAARRDRRMGQASVR